MCSMNENNLDEIYIQYSFRIHHKFRIIDKVIL